MTPRDIIKSSLRKLGLLGVGTEPTGQEITDALSCLNSMLDLWLTDRFLVYAKTRTVKVLTGGVASYTIGTGGDINVLQPEFLDDASARLIPVGGTYEYPISVLNSDEWAQLSNKTTQGIPYFLYFQRSAGLLGTLFPYYVPDQAHQLVLYLDSQLLQIPATDAGLSTDYLLRPGYLSAIQHSLAVFIASEYGVSVPPEVAALALQSYAMIKRANVEPITIACDEAILVRKPWGGSLGDILGGGWLR